jgi:predicted nucleotidyltransferase
MSELTGLSDDTIAVYRRAFEERERRKYAEREHRRQEALRAIRQAVRAVAPSYPAVQRVYLFGSVTRPGAFRPDSDVDVGVEGLDAAAWFDLWRDLEQAATGWTLDVRPLKPGDHFCERVRQRGTMIYGE